MSYIPLSNCHKGHECEAWTKNDEYYAGCKTCGLAVAGQTLSDVVSIWNECIRQDLTENPTKRV